MNRMPAKGDFSVPVGKLGTFTFARRSMEDEIKIQVEYARMIEGVEPTAWLSITCNWLATLKVLTVSAPSGFDVNDLDPLDEEVYVNMRDAYNALREKELSFRRKSGKAGEGERQAPVGDDGVLVSDKVQSNVE